MVGADRRAAVREPAAAVLERSVGSAIIRQNTSKNKSEGDLVLARSPDPEGADTAAPEDPESCVLPRAVFVVSDCTGESAAHTVRASLGQFESCFKLSVPANLILFRFVDCEERLKDIIERAREDDAMLVYTLVNTDMVKILETAAHYYKVPTVDLWGPLLSGMEAHLGTQRTGVPLTSMDTAARRPALSPDYFRMIEAVEFTRKMDDGASPENWREADLLLLGVSRSGKTPLSIYLGQRGYKVANLPLVPDVGVPPELYEIDQSKIVALIIDAGLLSEIRRNRLGSLGVLPGDMDYNKLKKCKAELVWATKLYGDNPEWPVLDVTFSSVEETAARLLRIMSERHGDQHPMWSSIDFASD